MAETAAVVIAGHTLRATIVGGADAIYTAELPELAGRKGRWTRSGMAGSVTYQRLRMPVPFTGTLLGCSDFIQKHYVHMGFHPAWKFEHVEELVFDSGRLVHHEDVSERLAEVREVLRALPRRPPPGALPADIEKWIERTFSLDF